MSCKPPFVEDMRIEQIQIDPYNETRNVQLSIKKSYIVLDVIKSCYASQLNNYGRNIDMEFSKRNIIIEFSSPNIAKPFHYGHLRSTIIGNFLSNLYTFLGHNVIRINYLGDWGTQYGLLSLAYDMYGSQDELIQNPCQHLLDVYIRIHKELEADSEKGLKLREEAKKRFQSLELSKDDNPDLLNQWIRFREYSVDHYKKMYDRLNIKFDEIHGESMYSKAALKIVKHLDRRQMIQTTDDGAKHLILNPDDHQESSSDTIDSDHVEDYVEKNLEHQDNSEDDHQNTEPQNDPMGVPLMKKDGSTLYLTRYLWLIMSFPLNLF